MLRVITRLNVGGPALHVGILSARLDPARFETLLVAGREGTLEGNMLALGRVGGAVRPHVVRSLRRPVSPGLDAVALFEMLAIARQFQPDVVHTHLAKAGLIGRIAGRLAGTPLIVHTYHGSVFHGYFGPRLSRAYLMIERSLSRISSQLIAVTARQRQELVALGVAPSSKIVEVPLGLDLAPFGVPIDPAAARRSLGIPESGRVVGIAARLVPIKDVATFIHAVGLLCGRIDDLRALVVGDGEQRESLERLAGDLGIGDRCIFTGWRADMPAVYAAIDVLALTSRNEGSPVTVIEAMAAGRAVVATAVGGVPDVVRDGETGCLVTPGDAAALADAVEMLLRDAGLRERLGKAGRSVAMARYDASRLVVDIERLYGDLLGADGR